MKKSLYHIIFLVPALLTCIVAFAQNEPDFTTAPAGSASLIALPNAYNQGGNTAPNNFNFTRAWIPVVPMTDSTGFTLATGYSFAGSTVRVKTEYQNGWGQPLLALTHRTHPVHDIATVYDNRARLSKASFLSYPTSTQNSHFQLTPFTDQRSFYQNLYPDEGGTSYSLNVQSAVAGIQSTSSYSPGKSFVGQGRGTTTSSSLNTSSENIRVWRLNAVGTPVSNTIYGDNTLSKVTTTGQHNVQSVEYTNRDGQLVCKKVQSDASTWLYTYYVYDDYGKIRYILTPKAITALAANNWQMNSSIQSGLCFSYVYDKYGQVIQRGIPGKNGLEYTVYDKKHRPVLHQNPLLQQSGKWQFTIYDKQGRTIMTGLVNSNNTQSAWTSTLDVGSSGVSAGTLEYYLVNEFDGVYPASNTSIAGCEIHEFYYYDTYNQDPALSGRTFDNSKNTEYLSGPEFVMPQPSDNTYGLLTGKRVFIPSAPGTFSSQWINTVIFYDRFGRVIQTQITGPFAKNIWDITTQQYSFDGNVVLTIDDHHAWASANKQATVVYKKYVYDLTTGRLKEIVQKTDSDQTWRYISQQSYDLLGRVNDKELGGVEHQVLGYNIRGQLTDLNKDFIDNPTSPQTQDMTFGLNLSYDYGFNSKRYDGAISGFIWKGSGHSPKRAYGYSYDQMGRMTKADFNEFSLSSANPFQNVWNKENIDYSVLDVAYDPNGNLLSMRQRGVDINGSGIQQPVDIDKLTYSYLPNSNTLDKVDDAVSANYHLEDFVNNNVGSGDYTYDADGNLASDANKGITSIIYNYLDLPREIVTNTGTITNVYDATGTLLEKTIVPGSGSPKVIRYWGAFTYENDELQYLLHEEGRCRWIASSNKFKYDYFVKDHLGNVRTTVTADEGGTKEYLATYELAAANTENLIFEEVDKHRAPKPGSNNVSDVKAALLNGESSEHRVGTSLLLRVMAGDKFNVAASHYYEEGTGTEASTSTEDMMNSVIAALAGGTTQVGSEGGGNPIDKLFTPSNYIGTYDRIKEAATDPSLPRAYLNYVVFDDRMQIVSEQSGALQVNATANSWQQISLPSEITIGQNGYLVVYISNEQHQDVFFDYLDITYYRGRLLEEQHYYPHGLVIRAGANNPVPNKFLYQGKLLQDELGLQLYDFHARQYDPQIGRFWGIDPADQFPSGYTGMANDPANNIDPTGMIANNYQWSGVTSVGEAVSESQYLLYNTDGPQSNNLYVDNEDDATADPGDEGKKDQQSTQEGEGFWGTLGKAWSEHVASMNERINSNPVTSFLGNTVAPTFNEYVNPLFWVSNGTYGAATGRDIITDQPVNRVSSGVNIAMAFIPGSFVEKAAMNVTERAAANVVEKQLQSAVQKEVKAGTTTVYRSFAADGTVQYVGITKNFASRQAQHLASKGIQIEKLYSNLPRELARGIEQALINMHGMQKNGGTLMNLINSVSKINPAYRQRLLMGYRYLRKMGYTF